MDLEAAQDLFKSAVSAAYSVLPQGNGHWAMYVCDLKNDLSGFAPPTASERMQAASLIKLYIMAAVYENFDSLSATYGQAALDDNLYPMITVSDNDAANALVGMLGGGDSQTGMNVVNDFCAAHGYTSTHMGRLLLASNEYDDNYTSVVDCGRFLREVYRSAQAEAGAANEEAGSVWTAPQVTSTLSHAGDMFNLLKAQTRRNKIPAALPDGVLVANKTGELGDVENDAGIIYDTDNGSDLVVVFMSENLGAVGEAQNAIANASRVLYDSYH
ncbi:MAG: serine hydrolase [Blautia sp.]|nr:serine hydrolase [Blautia sp.]